MINIILLLFLLIYCVVLVIKVKQQYVLHITEQKEQVKKKMNEYDHFSSSATSSFTINTESIQLLQKNNELLKKINNEL